MNRLDKLEEVLANRARNLENLRWEHESDDARVALDALPALLKVVRAVQNTDTRCVFRARPDPCGSCVMCVLRAALDPLIAPLACHHEYHVVGSNSVCKFCDRLEFCGRDTCSCSEKKP
jgi:hypothetical protein